ncbi:hypothetical protein BGK67_21780 [Streptomyces subrutilus]|uniref:DUF3152 domain-containing protein n=1 Tax=Streptomyces subrutilus TaxID=36818 RepID=A0A1E5Q1Y7_9ACTN|nr:hypothetical protein BGK67_21780 [Streptomyces subrutilus]
MYEERTRPRPETTVTHQGYVPEERPAPGGHPQHHERGGAWGARSDSVYGDWRGVPRPRTATALLDTDTPAFGTPAVGFPQVTLAPPAPEPASARVSGPARVPAPSRGPAPGPDRDPLTSTGSHRRVPAPRVPADALPVPQQPGSGRGSKVRTYTGMAAAAVTTVLAVVVAGQVAADGESARRGTLAATDDSRAEGAASRSDGRPTPEVPPVQAPAQAPAPAPELTYEQKMAQQLPIDEKLTGSGVFDTVPGVAKAPGKGRLVRYRVDVEQGLGLDPQLFAEAVHRTLNDDRSWGHGGTKTFERVPGGETDFVITLASPGTTGKWCAKSNLDTTVDNVSCDSAATERVMINAFRWAQGAATFGPDQMLAYRQMLINHEVGHRLGNGHVNCRTPGALAPIMQQQTKSLDIDGVQCKPNPWVFPGS